MKISPGSLKPWPNSISEALACKFSLIIVFKDKTISDKRCAQFSEFNFAVKAVLMDLMALSAMPFDRGYRTLLTL